MFEAKFKLKHKGCWTQGLRKFKSKFVTHNTVSLTEDFVQDITEVSLFNKSEKNKILFNFVAPKFTSSSHRLVIYRISCLNFSSLPFIVSS